MPKMSKKSHQETAKVLYQEHYVAPASNSLSAWGWTKRIALRLLFLPLLLWDGLKWAANSLFGRQMSFLILPAQLMCHMDWQGRDLSDQGLRDCLLNAKGEPYETHRVQVETHDGALLDTLEIRYRDAADGKTTNQRNHIIYFPGNTAHYEVLLPEMAKTAVALKCNVIGFNLRGVRFSQGQAWSRDDLVTDGIAQVQRLLDQGVDPSRIILNGHSLGGGIATLVAKHFHDKKINVKLFNDRSFSSLTNVAAGWIRGIGYGNGRKIYFLERMLAWISKPFIKFFLSITKWEIDVARAFKALPNSHKEYLVVRSPESQRADDRWLQDDAVIPHYASLHTALKGERRKVKRALRRSIAYHKQYSSQKHQEALSKAKLKLATVKGISSAHKVTVHGNGGHHAPLDVLTMRNPKILNKGALLLSPYALMMGNPEIKDIHNANTFFWHFVERDSNNISHDTTPRSGTDHRRKVA